MTETHPVALFGKPVVFDPIAFAHIEAYYAYKVHDARSQQKASVFSRGRNAY